MKRMFKKFLVISLVLMAGLNVFSQGTINGKIQDDKGESLIGVSIVENGTNNGTITDSEGKFKLNVKESTGVLVFSFIGFESAVVEFDLSESKTVGIINMKSADVSLDDVIVIGKGVIDVDNRITPIASTVISKIEIKTKAVGNVEFPEIMKNTPNVYVAAQSGGFGESQMFTRGFNQSNTAFLLNGQPINGMEDGKMYWSNWSGISDIANAVDIQRGLGSSKLAISSVGGTINIVTKATEKRKSGFVRFIGGNGKFLKGTVGYNTGLLQNGWGVSVLFDYWQAERKWADGTKGRGQNYFVSIGKNIKDHNLNFLIFGAPQWHDQNFSKKLELYKKYDTKYNDNWGNKDGEYTTYRRNYYHKPVMNLNWDWDINSTIDLSTVVYASFGRGGGTGPYGSSKQYRKYDSDGQMDFDKVVENNKAISSGIGSYGKAAALRASVNNHQWYGAVSNLKYDPQDNFSINFGTDIRFYKGDHFRQLVDLFGLNGWEDSYKRYKGSLDADGKYIVSKTYDANPWAALSNFASNEDRIAYNSSEWINYQGAFGQFEYKQDGFSAFFQGAVSNQSYQKEERFSKDNEKSEKLNRSGYNLKGGTAYNINDKHVVFANLGYYSRQPFLDNIYEYGSIKKRENEVENEKITGFELGYKGKFAARSTLNVNFYYTKWANRFLGINVEDYVTVAGKDTVSDAGLRMTNIAQVHKGVELEAATYLTDKFKVKFYATYGDWVYDGSTPVEVVDNNKNSKLVENFNVDLKGTHVGEAPQASLGIGLQYNTNKFRIYVDGNYYDNLYGFADVKKVATASLENKDYEPEELDSYFLLDAGASFTVFSKRDAGALKARANIYNVLNSEYIGSKNQYGYYYGNGMTFNLGVTYEF